jgi:hypothetical protein
VAEAGDTLTIPYGWVPISFARLWLAEKDSPSASTDSQYFAALAVSRGLWGAWPWGTGCSIQEPACNVEWSMHAKKNILSMHMQYVGRTPKVSYMKALCLKKLSLIVVCRQGEPLPFPPTGNPRPCFLHQRFKSRLAVVNAALF